MEPTSPSSQSPASELFRGLVQLLIEAINNPRFREFITIIPEAIALAQRFPDEITAALIGEGVFPHPDLSLSALTDVVTAYRELGVPAAVQRLHELHLELFAGIREAGIIERRWRNSSRWPALSDVLGAHDAGLYFASVTLAIAQAEGVIADGMRHKGQMNHKKFRAYINDLCAGRDYEGILLQNFVDKFLLDTFEHGDPPKSFSRHAIVHGGALNYGTLEKSIRALVWLDYLLIIFEERAAEQLNAAIQ